MKRPVLRVEEVKEAKSRAFWFNHKGGLCLMQYVNGELKALAFWNGSELKDYQVFES